VIAPTLSPASVPSWPAVYRDAVRIVKLGTGMQIGPDFLLWRLRTGKVVGVLKLDPHGGFMVHVDPHHRRKGIASRLLDEALRHWPLDVAGERYTPDGAAWISAWRAQR